ncbi:MAG: hypothetical protein ABIO60_07275 [Aquaticitalea sp.]
MKKINKILTGAVVILMMNCGNAKNGATSNSGNTMSDDISTEISTRAKGATSNRNYNYKPTTREVGEKSNGNRNLSINNTSMENQDTTLNQADYDPQRTKLMYTTADMNSEQIQRYETASTTWMAGWNKNNIYGALSNQEVLQQQSTTLRLILDDLQYQRYEQWMQQNPYRN